MYRQYLEGLRAACRQAGEDGSPVASCGQGVNARGSFPQGTRGRRVMDASTATLLARVGSASPTPLYQEQCNQRRRGRMWEQTRIGANASGGSSGVR